MIGFLRCLVCFAGLLFIVPVLAQDDAQNASLADMLKRDRFGPPGPELAAWKAFSAKHWQDHSLTALERAQIQLRLAISYYYAASYKDGLAALRLAEKQAADLADRPTTFDVEVASYKTLFLADLRRPDAAREAAQEALAAANVAVDNAPPLSYEAALSLNVAGYQAYQNGDTGTARALMCQAAEVARAALPSTNPLVHLNANNCGVFAYFLDDPQAAQIMERSANAAMAALPQGHPTVGQALNLSYSVLQQFGFFERAAALSRQHMDMERAMRGDTSNRVYDPASMLARNLLSQGKLEEAAEIQRQVIALADKIVGAGDFRQRGFSRVLLARILDQLGQLSESTPLHQRGIALLEEAKGAASSPTAQARMDYALHLYQRGETTKAIATGRLAMKHLNAALEPGHIARVTGALKLGLLLSGDDRCAEALELARTGQRTLTARFAQLSQKRAGRIARVDDLQTGFAYSAEVGASCGDMDLAVRAAQLYSQAELALSVTNLTARLLEDDEGLAHADAAVRRARRAEDDAQNKLEACLVAKPACTDAAQKAEVLQRATAHRKAREKALADDYPGFGRLIASKAAPLKDVQASLKEEQAAIFVLPGEGQMLTLAVTSAQVAAGFSAMSPATFSAALHSVLENVAARRVTGKSVLKPFSSNTSKQLYDSVFAPGVQDALKDVNHLIFPASGPLAALPPALLVTNIEAGKPRYLIEDMSLSLRPILVASKPSQASAARQLGYLGFGDPSAIDKYPRLPRAKRELRALRALFGPSNSSLALGKAFTKAAVLTAAPGKNDIAVFSTHGLTAQETSVRLGPALLLGGPKQAALEDRLLTAADIASSRFAAQWVFLSACNSAGARRPGAPPFTGLAQAFISAGARALTVTHWPVRDGAAAQMNTAALIAYQNGATKAEALRRAQRALMRSAQGETHPALWAPYVLIEN